MANVITILSSPRKKGYTAGLLDCAIRGLESFGVEIIKINLPEYVFQPCAGCFSCIGDEKHRCVLKDDMGNKDGGLVPLLLETNGMIIADPVYGWNMSARAHVFFERLYPQLWSGKLNGMPFASISSATNQGMMREATAQIAKTAFTYKFRYIDGISAHAADYASAQKQAHYAGQKLAVAALEDEKKRVPFTDAQAFALYADSLWPPLENYIDNLTSGSGNWRNSLVYRALSEDVFSSEDGKKNLEKASDILRRLLSDRKSDNDADCMEAIARLSAHWTEATWHEYVKKIVEAKKPKTYRPVGD